MVQQQSTVAAPTKPPREQWMDTVKGVAITLVVFGHSIKILEDKDWPISTIWNHLNIVMAEWRMPVFMLVAGFFVTRSITKYGDRFWRMRPLNMLWLFVFWTAIYWATYPLIGAVDRTMSAWEMFMQVFNSTMTFHSYLWFLLALCIYYAVQGLLGVTHKIWAVVLASVLFVLFAPGLVDDYSWGTNEMFSNWLFFLVGAWWSQDIRNWVARVSTKQGILWCLAFMASILVWMPTRDKFLIENIGGALPPLCAIPAGLFLLSRFDGKPGMRWARYVGTKSLAVYVVHPLLMQFMVAVLTWLIIDPQSSGLATAVLWVGPPVFTILAVVLCLGIRRATLNVPFLWGLPAPKKQPASA